jgi:hypothetical protein
MGVLERLSKLENDVSVSARDGIDPPVRHNLTSLGQRFLDAARPDRLDHAARVTVEKGKATMPSKRALGVKAVSTAAGYGVAKAGYGVAKGIAIAAAGAAATGAAATGVGLGIAAGLIVTAVVVTKIVRQIQKSDYKKILENPPSDEKNLKALVFMLIQDGQLDHLYRSFGKIFRAEKKYDEEVKKRNWACALPDNINCVDAVWVLYRLLYWRKRLHDRLHESNDWASLRKALDLVKATTVNAENLLVNGARAVVAQYAKTHQGVGGANARLPRDGLLNWTEEARRYPNCDFSELARLLSRHQPTYQNALNQLIDEVGPRSSLSSLAQDNTQLLIVDVSTVHGSIAGACFDSLAHAGVSNMWVAAGSGLAGGLSSFFVALALTAFADSINDNMNIEFLRNPTNADQHEERVKRLRSMLLQGRLDSLVDAFSSVRDYLRNNQNIAQELDAPLEKLYDLQKHYLTLLSVSCLMETMLQTMSQVFEQMARRYNEAYDAWRWFMQRQNAGQHLNCKGTCYKGDQNGNPVHPLR